MPGKRQHLIDTMDRLISEQGIRATGIDQIIAEAGVAKMTLYNNFRSKDELVLAAVREHDEAFRLYFARELEGRSKDAKTRLAMVFDVVAEWMETPGFMGCFFSRAASEYPKLDHPIHRAAAEHKQLFREYLWGLTTAAGASDPVELGEQIWMLVEGAITARFICGDRDAIHRAKRAGELIIDAALG